MRASAAPASSSRSTSPVSRRRSSPTTPISRRFGLLGRARAPLRAAMIERFGLGPQLAGGRGRLQRRLSAAAFPRRRRAGARHRAGGQCRRGGGRQRRADRSRLLRPRDRRAARRARRPRRSDRRQQRARPCARTSATSSPASPILLAAEGVATFEFPHLLNLIRDVQFDTIYHEHFSYLSLIAVEAVFAACGLRAFDVEELPTHGGSLRLYACRAGAAHRETEPARRAARQGARRRSRPARRLSRLRAAGRGGASATSSPSSPRRAPRASASPPMARRRRATRSSMSAASAPTTSSACSTAAPPSRASCCPAAICRSSRRNSSPRCGPTISSCCRGTCSMKSAARLGDRRLGRPLGRRPAAPRGDRAMKFAPTELPGVARVSLERFADPRGFFARLHDPRNSPPPAFPFTPAQTSLSRNDAAFTLRGLHFQAPPHDEAKLVRVVRGARLRRRRRPPPRQPDLQALDRRDAQRRQWRSAVHPRRLRPRLPDPRRRDRRALPDRPSPRSGPRARPALRRSGDRRRWPAAPRVIAPADLAWPGLSGVSLAATRILTASRRAGAGALSSRHACRRI